MRCLSCAQSLRVWAPWYYFPCFRVVSLRFFSRNVLSFWAFSFPYFLSCSKVGRRRVLPLLVAIVAFCKRKKIRVCATDGPELNPGDHGRPNYYILYLSKIKSCGETGLDYSNKIPHCSQRKSCNCNRLIHGVREEQHLSLHYTNEFPRTFML